MKKIIAIAPLLLALAVVPTTVSAQDQTTPGLAFVAIEVSDMVRAKAFYVDTLGMKPVVTISKPSDPYEKVGYNFSGNPRSDETLLILIHYSAPKAGQNMSSGTKIGIRVKDSRAMAARVRAAGYQLLSEPKADAKGPVLNSVVRDPDGVIVEMVELRLP